MLREGMARVAGTTAGRLMLLAAAVLGLWLASIGIATATGSFDDLGDAAWSGLRHLLDPGALDGDETASRRIIGVVQVLAGLLLLAGVLFAVIEDLIDRGLNRLSEAQPPLGVGGHVLIIGEGPLLAALTRALPDDPAAAGVRDVVLLVPPDADTAPARLPGGMRLHIRRGDPLEPGTLAAVSARRARAIVVLSPPEPDSKTADLRALGITAAIAAELADDGSQRPLVSVEICRAANIEHLWRQPPDGFDAVLRDRDVGAALSLAVANPHFAAELIGSGVEAGKQLPFVVSAADLAGERFGDGLAHLPRALPVGLVRDGRASFAPPPDEIIRPDDRLIVLADSWADAREHRQAGGRGDEAGTTPLLVEEAPPPSLLLLGWSGMGRDLLAELGPGTTPSILVRDTHDGVPQHARTVPALDDPTVLAEALETVDPGAVVVLAGANGGADSRNAHAYAALVALHLCRAAGSRSLPILVEQHSLASARQLRDLDPRIQVVSLSERIASALLLSALDRPRQDAIQALATDPDIRMRTLRVDGAHQAALPQAWRELLGRGMALVNVVREGRPLSLGDPLETSLRVGDLLLVISRPPGATSGALEDGRAANRPSEG